MYFLYAWIVLTQRWQRSNTILVLLIYYEKFCYSTSAQKFPN